jgi:hypothetical protein
LLWLPPKFAAFRIDAKRQSCDFNQAIMEFGALQCVPKVQIVVFACLTIVVLRSKE